MPRSVPDHPLQPAGAWSGDGWWVPVALLAAALLALPVDCWLAGWCLETKFPGMVRKLVQTGELFGHGAGVLLTCALIHQLDRRRRWAIPRLLVCAFGAGLAADVVKMLVARARPHHFDLSSGVAASFLSWLPLTSAGSAGQSFPSAHVATAVGMCVVLIQLYPQARPLFAVMAALTALSRILSSAHFLSDILCGAAVGYCVAGWINLRLRVPGPAIARLPAAEQVAA